MKEVKENHKLSNTTKNITSSFGEYQKKINTIDTPYRYFVSLRIQSECGKIRTRKTPNTDTFQAVFRPATLFEKDPQAQLLVSINFLQVINL